MKIILPHREVILDINPKTILPVNKRKEIVNDILSEEIVFHSEKMTVEEYLIYTWEKQSSKAILDMFGYFLSKDNPTEEQKNDTNYLGKPIKEDRFIISETEREQIQKGHPRYKTVEDMNYELYGEKYNS